MIKSTTFALTAALALQVAVSPASAATLATNTVVLDAVIVTPRAHYGAAEWQAHQAGKAAAAVTLLEPVIVTPKAHYTLAEWQQHETGLAYVRHEVKKTGVRGWLLAVWKHFPFVRSPLAV